MHKIIMAAAAAATLAACTKEAAAPTANDANAAVATPAATPAAMSLNETTWTFTRDGTATTESIDASGNYVATGTKDSKHLDHGTVVMKDDKACFTSAMTKEGEICWTIADTAIGQSTETTSDKGEKLMVTRVAYVPPPPM